VRPSLKHIAEECGVTAMTVSMALRDDPSISEKRRIEIKAIAERIGYRPNVIARSLRGGKTNSIGILWSLGGPHNPIDLVRNVSLKLMHLNYVTYIADSLSDPEIINSCLADYAARSVDGLIIQQGTEFELEKLLSPAVMQCLKEIGNIVIVNETGIDLPAKLQFDEIKRSRQIAIEEIIDYLVKKGRKKIAMLASPLTPWREQHFIDCLKAHKLDYGNCRLISTAQSTTIPGEIFNQLDSGPIEYNAILTQNDELAAQLINYLQQRNVKVPDDVAVTGFNNSFFGQYFTPPIASVERRSLEISEAAVTFLMNRIKKPNMPLQQVELPMHFVKRVSAG
jgi:DNA-binding LacI/PurR family transcriptional regulator